MLNEHDDVYDAISRVLTDYEGNGDQGSKGDPEPLYELLVDIQNMMAAGTIEQRKEW